MMDLLTAMLSLLFSAERAKPIQLLLWFCHADPARRHVIPPSLVTKTSAHLPRIVSNNEKKPKEKWKRRMWQEKQQGWSFRSRTGTAFASSRSSLRCRRAAQEHWAQTWPQTTPGEGLWGSPASWQPQQALHSPQPDSLPLPACSKGGWSTDPTWLWHSVVQRRKGHLEQKRERKRQELELLIRNLN